MEPGRSAIEGMSSIQLADFLQQNDHLDLHLIETLMREEIDGDTLLSMPVKDLKELSGFTYGSANRLIRTVRSCLASAPSSNSFSPKVELPVTVVATSGSLPTLTPQNPALIRSKTTLLSVEPLPAVTNSVLTTIPVNIQDPGVSYDRIFKAKPSGCEKEEEMFYGKKYLKHFHRTQNLVHNLNVKKVRSWFGDTEDGKRGREVVTANYVGRLEKSLAIKGYIAARIHELEPLQFQEKGTNIRFNWRVEDIYSHWFSNHVKRNKNLKPTISVSVSGDSSPDLEPTVEAESLRKEEQEFVSHATSENVKVVLYSVASPISASDIINRENEMLPDVNMTCRQPLSRAFAIGFPQRLIRSIPYRAWTVKILQLLPQDVGLLEYYVPSPTVQRVREIREEEVIEIPQVFMSLEYQNTRDLTPQHFGAGTLDITGATIGSQSSHESLLITHDQHVTEHRGEVKLSTVPVSHRSPLPGQVSKEEHMPFISSGTEDGDTELEPSEDEDAELYKAATLLQNPSRKKLPCKIPAQGVCTPKPVGSPDSSVDTSEFRPTKTTTELLQKTSKVEANLAEYGYELLPSAPAAKRLKKTDHNKENVQPVTAKDLRAFMGIGAKKVPLKGILKKKLDSTQATTPAPGPDDNLPPVPGVFGILSELSKKIIAAAVMGPDEFKGSTVLASISKWVANQNRLAKAESRSPPFTGHQLMEPWKLLDLVVKWALQTKVKIGGNLKMSGSLLVLNKTNIRPLNKE